MLPETIITIAGVIVALATMAVLLGSICAPLLFALAACAIAMGLRSTRPGRTGNGPRPARSRRTRWAFPVTPRCPNSASLLFRKQ